MDFSHMNMPPSQSNEKRKRNHSTITAKINNTSKALVSSTTKSNKISKKKLKRKSALTSKGFQRHFAQHDYRDYARTKIEELDLADGPDTKIKISKGGVHNPFPTVLHAMMEQADKKGFEDIISWQPHGRAFLIHKPKIFVESVLPNYFKHSKLSSFQRQLSLYGFVRLTHDSPDRGAYYHQCFLRGRPFLCCKINRTRIKGTWVRTSSSPETEPNFYAMEPVMDLDQIDLPSNREQASLASNLKAAIVSSDEEPYRSEDSVRSSTVHSPSYSSQPCPNHSSREELRWLHQAAGPSQSQNATLDMLHSIDTAKFSVSVNSNITYTGLLPPPAFPTHVVGGTEGQNQVAELPFSRISSVSRRVSQDSEQGKMAMETPQQFSEPFASSNSVANRNTTPKFPETFDIPSLASLGSSALGCEQASIFGPSLNDNELANFLTDVNLDTTDDITDDIIEMFSV